MTNEKRLTDEFVVDDYQADSLTTLNFALVGVDDDCIDEACCECVACSRDEIRLGSCDADNAYLCDYRVGGNGLDDRAHRLV